MTGLKAREFQPPDGAISSQLIAERFELSGTEMQAPMDRPPSAARPEFQRQLTFADRGGRKLIRLTHMKPGRTS